MSRCSQGVGRMLPQDLSENQQKAILPIPRFPSCFCHLQAKARAKIDSGTQKQWHHHDRLAVPCNQFLPGEARARSPDEKQLEKSRV